MRLQRFSHLFSEIGFSSQQNLDIPLCRNRNVYLDIKRDDLLHSIISGNKWRKLKYLMLMLEAQGVKKIALMGGAYSNLLHSMAYLCHRMQWPLELFVRGYPEQALSPTLQDAKSWSATLTYVDRQTYRTLRQIPPELDPDTFWLTEGGMHSTALMGTEETFMELNQDYDYVVMATATGTSLAGLAQGAHKQNSQAKIIGVSVLNNAAQVEADLEHILDKRIKRPQLHSGYVFGGYAKSNEQLSNFISGFEANHQIPLEPVYSGKSFYATLDLIGKGFFPEGSRILLIHCGGLQGKR